MNKKARSREQRTKRGSASKQIAVRIMINQPEFDRLKVLEREHVATREEIFLRGLQSCNSR